MTTPPMTVSSNIPTRQEHPASPPNSSFPPKATRIVVVLDESGSMKEVQNEVITSLNTFINEQKSIEGECLLTIVKFDTSVTPLLNDIPISNTQLLTREHYNPDQGFTALYDAVGYVFQKFGNETNVIVVILTDGEENASMTYSSSSIKELITTYKSPSPHNWSFVYLADSPDLLEQGRNMGITQSSSSSISSSPFSSLPLIAMNLSRQVTRFRTGLDQ